MPQQFKYYIILATGVIVCLVGVINFFTNYGDSSFSGIVGQITGIIVVIGGAVNLLVASQIKQDIARREGEKEARRN